MNSLKLHDIIKHAQSKRCISCILGYKPVRRITVEEMAPLHDMVRELNMESAETPDRIYDSLRRQIVQFDLLPGQVLSENALAAELGVSRTPVRNALSRLLEEGCINVYPQRGTEVSYISLERVRQAVFLNKVLEQDMLTRLCAGPISDEPFSRLTDSVARQRRFYDRQQFEDLLYEDSRMHRMFFQLGGCGIGWTAVNYLNCDLMRIHYLLIRTYSYKVPMAAVDSWENSMTEHRMILDALRKRDTDAVCLLSDNHITQVLWKADTLRQIYPAYFQAKSE